MNLIKKDLIIIGGGPAGLSAAQYGARGGLELLLIEESVTGGQALLIDNLENYPGYDTPISGYELAQRFQKQATQFGVEFKYDSIQSIKKENDYFILKSESAEYQALAVIIATGAKHRELGCKGEKEFQGKGVSYCATCDGPFFKGQPILVVGGGDAACDEALFLSKISPKVTQIHRKERFRAQKIVAQRVLNHPHIKVQFNSVLKEIKGSNKVESVVIENLLERTTKEIAFNAVFIFVGMEPQSGLVKDLVDVDETGYIKTDETMQSSCKGLFAVGDVRTTPFRQIVTAASDGAIAAHAATLYIDELKDQKYGE